MIHPSERNPGRSSNLIWIASKLDGIPVANRNEMMPEGSLRLKIRRGDLVVVPPSQHQYNQPLTVSRASLYWWKKTDSGIGLSDLRELRQLC